MKTIVCSGEGFGANCYIIYDEVNKQGVIIDAAENSSGILEICRQNELDIKFIILTHGHFDHIGAVAEVKAATGAQILMNKKDEFLIKNTPYEFKTYYESIKKFEIDGDLRDGDIIKLKDLECSVIETPGHTPGGVCIKIGNILFSGDTLFRNSIGRTDFEFGDFNQIIASIKNKLLVLEDNTIVYPGHGTSTTIGYERNFNNFLY